jgi:hypothetical protein
MGRTKSNKNKVKQAQIKPQLTPVESLCKICDRVRFGKTVSLGFDTWRHDNCAIGSEAYSLYYQRQSYSVQKVLRPFYNLFQGVL